MRCPSVRQSSAIRWLIENPSRAFFVQRAPAPEHDAGLRVRRIDARRSKNPKLCELPRHSLFRKKAEQPKRERRVEMSEYPRTGIDKALLKFALQDRKISQIVSVKVSAFFPTFCRQLLPDCLFDGQPKGLYLGLSDALCLFDPQTLRDACHVTFAHALR
jgi:hypothetical protein